MILSNKMLQWIGEKKTCRTPTDSCAATEIFNDSYDVAIGGVFLHNCSYDFMPYPDKCFLEIYEDTAEI